MRCLCRIFLHPVDISLKLLSESTSYFGYSPRLCFQASLSVDILEYAVKDTESEIRWAAKETGDNIMKLLLSTRTGDSDVSYTIFQIFPANDNARRLLCECHFEPVSRWALDILLSEYEAHQANEFQRCVGQPRFGVICSKGRY